MRSEVPRVFEIEERTTLQSLEGAAEEVEEFGEQVETED